MGCDIHLHTEVKIAGVWHHYGAPSVARNYRVFAKMADVRNYDQESQPICQPRGIPPDVTDLTRFDCDDWDRDGHSHSWLSAPEISELTDYIDEEMKVRCADNFGYLFGNSWGGFWKYRGHENSGIPKGVEDVRFVFWFDN